MSINKHGPAEVINWIKEREENSLRIAKTKTGLDRQGWLDDAAFYSSCIELLQERNRFDELLNTPEFHDFMKGVPLEAAHQVERWGTDHDAGKTCLDWFWLIGYLAQRVVEYDKAGNHDKALHHCITTAAALMNWHAALEHHYNGREYPMRPGHAPAVATGEKAA